ncbi:MAG: cytochrome bc complex cytochrome b subunit [Brachymonas sp.]|nr:cytochrome bc complex cytochrome b subunit [Brachymonas sp.]
MSTDSKPPAAAENLAQAASAAQAHVPPAPDNHGASQPLHSLPADLPKGDLASAAEEASTQPVQETAPAAPALPPALHRAGPAQAPAQAAQELGLPQKTEEQAASKQTAPEPTDTGIGTGLPAWLAQRLPSLLGWYQRHVRNYFVPKNLNIWYVFGALALLVLGMQLLTGLALAVHYKADAQQAFDSLQHIMRHVRGGALIRYAHSTGASAIFILLYLHMARGLLYGSYRKPRELVWLLGCALFVLVMAEAFVGHLLPWGQTSYWGTQVITQLLGSIPGVGPWLADVLRGGPEVGSATLSRFFVLHIIVIPLLLLGLVALHVLALHDVGPSNPDGVDLAQGPHCNRWSATAPADTVPFHPYYTVRDAWAAGVFLTVFFAIVFFAPEMGGHFLEPANFMPANPLQTPPHITPVWYFRPFYAILRSMTAGATQLLALAVPWLALWGLRAGRVKGRRWQGGVLLALGLSLLLGLVPTGLAWVQAPAAALQAWEQFARWPENVPVLGRLWWLLCMGIDASFWGLAAMVAAIALLCALPWLDRSPVASIRYRPRWHRWVYGLFAAAFVLLGAVGGLPATGLNVLLGQVATLGYFAFFLLMPWWSRQGTFRPVPLRLTGRGGARAAAEAAPASQKTKVQPEEPSS